MAGRSHGGVVSESLNIGHNFHPTNTPDSVTNRSKSIGMAGEGIDFIKDRCRPARIARIGI
jgi:hypothetical protein